MRKRRVLREADQRRDTALRQVAVTLFTLDASGCCTFAQGRHCGVLGLLPDAPVPSSSPLHDPARRALAGETVDVALDAGTTALDETAAGPVALLHLDVDDFKLVNVGLGHEAGDVVLGELAWRLAAAAPTGATLTRLGEDHFVLVVPGDADAARSAAHALLDAVQAPFTVAGAEFHLGATIGIGLSGVHAQSPDALLTAAELAGHQAKHGRRGGYAFYQEDGSDPRRRLALTTRLRHAIDDGEFVLHYQPVYHLATGVLHRVEALIRWQHPEEGTISPVAFIPLAEETGLIQGIGDWVIDAVVRQAAAWEAEGIRPHISFNVAPAQLHRALFADRLGDRFREAALPPTGFTVEITESAAMSGAQETRRVLEQLEDIGVRIALDDFGTDDSSLARLRTLPIHELKIDRPFLAGVPADGREVGAGQGDVTTAAVAPAPVAVR